MSTAEDALPDALVVADCKARGLHAEKTAGIGRNGADVWAVFSPMRTLHISVEGPMSVRMLETMIATLKDSALRLA